MKQEEGYIKFNLKWNNKPFDFINHDFIAINSCRDKLFNYGLIGAYPDGIGYGNLSIRDTKNEFIITGSATGNLKKLSKKHYALVKDFNIQKNSIECDGLTKASSESLSHGVIYQSNPEVNAVIHIHHKNMWEHYLNKLPTTDKKAVFGTPEMAIALKNLIHQHSGIIIMGGHQEGIITYGRSLETAEEILFKYYNNLEA